MRRLLAASLVLFALPLAAQVQQGLTLFEQARYEEARRALAGYPNDAQALFILARIALLHNDPEGAATLLEKAVDLRPKIAEYHFWLGSAYGNYALQASLFKQMGLARKTKVEFERAVELDPNFTDARFGLIDYYLLAPAIMGGSETKALNQAAEIRRRDPLMGHRAYARVYARQKKNDLARKEYQDAVREQPASPIAHTSLGTWYGMNDKNVKGGFDELETALKLDPAYLVAWFRFGQLAATTGANLTRGEDALRKYLDYHPKSSEPDLASANYYLGMVYEKQGRKAEARQHYAAAARMNPQSHTFSDALKRVS